VAEGMEERNNLFYRGTILAKASLPIAPHSIQNPQNVLKTYMSLSVEFFLKQKTQK